ncbi:hypothetical protein AHF37_12220 [Paragonimus kellicotti]|nr:hypothetical protein AHF37_12220 [Paragonimus kellicotti]
MVFFSSCLCSVEPASASLCATVLEDFSMTVQTTLDEGCTPNLSTTSSKQQRKTPTFQPITQTKSTDRNAIYTKQKREPLTKQLEGDVRNTGDFVSSKQKNMNNEQTKAVGQSEDRPHSHQYSSNTTRGTIEQKQDHYETGIHGPVAGGSATVQTLTSHVTPIVHVSEFSCSNKPLVQTDHDVYVKNTHPVDIQLPESTFVPKTLPGIISQQSSLPSVNLTRVIKRTKKTNGSLDNKPNMTINSTQTGPKQ